MKNSLYIVDGSSYIFRAYFGITTRLTSRDGTPTNAVFGFKNMLSNLLSTYSPSHVVMIFDPPGPTERHTIYSDYKANRSDAPADLVPQFALIHQLVDAMNMPKIVLPGIEADDLIGSLADKFRSEADIFIVSSDKDLTQLIGNGVVMVDTMKNVTMDEAAVLAKYGVPPARIAEYLALTGDSSDNIPGAAGIGPKGAAKLLQDYGSLAGVSEKLVEIKGKLGENLRNSWHNVLLSLRLTTINRAIETGHSLKDFQRAEPDADTMRKLYRELNFRSDKIVKGVENAEQSESAPSTISSEQPAKGQTKSGIEYEVAGGDAKLESISRQPEINRSSYRTITSEEELDKIIVAIKAAGKFCFDFETTGLDYFSADIVGIAFAGEGFAPCYVPLRHQALDDAGTNQIPAENAMAKLRNLLEDESITVVCHNIKFECHVLREHGILVKALAEDTMLASYLLDAHLNTHGLDRLAMQHFGHTMIPFSDVVGKGKNEIGFAQITIQQATEYAAEDADVTWKLYGQLRPRLEKHGLESLYRDVEMPLASVLCNMEAAGVMIDTRHFSELGRIFRKQSLELEGKIYEVAGERFNINSPKQLGEVLFDKMGIGEHIKRNKTGLSTDASVLEKLAPKHEIAGLVLSYRMLIKLLSTYVDSLPDQINRKTGRIHTSYNQSVASTGRLSSTNPNLQNIPIKGEEGRKIRHGFIAAEGYRLLSIDYSQIELRVLAHMTGDEVLIESFRDNIDIHSRTASLILKVPEEQVNADQRRIAKAINFGIIYGMGAFRLANETGLTNAQAKDFIDAYFANFPGIRDYVAETVSHARETQHVETILKRRRFIPDIASSNANLRKRAERTAVNTTIQGSAADIIKVAMIKADQYLSKGRYKSRMIMQVHDELVFEVKEDEMDTLAPQLHELMENTIKLKVPLAVSGGSGKTWGDAHE